MKRPSSVSPSTNKRQKPLAKEVVNLPAKLPVSTLCGFLGAGKTTLLKHILESKHTEGGDFKCAVIVNDMAEINIDKSLIDLSGLVQSNDVIAMQNGCACCTLQNDLVNQIIELAKAKKFHYMMIEASGVSEPSQIAKLFADCEGDHDHTEEDAHQLNEFAKLDTCVTVVDAGDFFNKFQTIRQGPKNENLPQLLIEQIEYANVIVLNKIDLVSSAQLSKVIDQVSILNSNAKILTSSKSRIEVTEVVNTGLYKAGAFGSLEEDEEEETYMANCCREFIARGELPCCRINHTLDSGKSKVTLGSNRRSTPYSFAKPQPRHASRFGITSFIYQARRPFHPDRFHQDLVEQFFMLHKGEGSQGVENGTPIEKNSRRKSDEQKKKDRQKETVIRKKQKEAVAKHDLRIGAMGDLFRSKGFIWLASNHDLAGVLNTAGNVLTIEFPGTWSVLQAEAYQGTEKEMAALRKDWVAPWGDRRQDLVFIGKDLKHQTIQEILDNCLLTDEELAMGIDGWKAVMGDAILDAALEGSDRESDE